MCWRHLLPNVAVSVRHGPLRCDGVSISKASTGLIMELLGLANHDKKKCVHLQGVVPSPNLK